MGEREREERERDRGRGRRGGEVGNGGGKERSWQVGKWSRVGGGAQAGARRTEGVEGGGGSEERRHRVRGASRRE